VPEGACSTQRTRMKKQQPSNILINKILKYNNNNNNNNNNNEMEYSLNCANLKQGR
jgi:hypothetical protein